MSHQTPINAPANTLPIVDKRGGVVTIDQPFKANGVAAEQTCTKIHIGTGSPELGGTIILEMEDGNVDIYFKKMSDSIILTNARRVLSSAEINGVIQETSVSDVTWHGGF